MTNKDKFLKEGAIESDFPDLLTEYILNSSVDNCINIRQLIYDFFNEQVKPTLTEDERVILRNLQPEITLIGRNGANELFIAIESTNEFVDFYCYDHLFQFIKERRRIFNK